MSRDFSWITFSTTTWRPLDLPRAWLRHLYRHDSARNLTSAISTFLEVPHVLLTNLGRTALFLALKSLNLGHGEGVLVSALVCPTVIKAIIRAGCKPVFADVEHNLHISARTLEESFQRGVRAVLVPHLYGLAAPIEEIESWATDRKICLIDDAAQAVGLLKSKRQLGTFGDAGILSFGPFKNLAALRGGALVSRDEEIILRASRIPISSEPILAPFRRALSGCFRFHARSLFLARPSNNKLALSGTFRKLRLGPGSIDSDEMYRLSTMDAEIILCALSRCSSDFQFRGESAQSLRRELIDFEEHETMEAFRTPYVKIPIRLKNVVSANEAVSHLRAMRIEAERIYAPANLIAEFSQFAMKDLPTSLNCWETTILVPNPVSCAGTDLRRFINALTFLGKPNI
jgi:dTDP-4-amino-4,6-dideoxygalactose transaminase